METENTVKIRPARLTFVTECSFVHHRFTFSCQVLVMDWVPLTVDAVLFYRVKRVLDGTLATHTLALTPVETPGSELVCHRALDVSLQSDLGVYSFTLGVRRTPV